MSITDLRESMQRQAAQKAAALGYLHERHCCLCLSNGYQHQTSDTGPLRGDVACAIFSSGTGVMTNWQSEYRLHLPPKGAHFWYLGEVRNCSKFKSMLSLVAAHDTSLFDGHHIIMHVFYILHAFCTAY